MRIAFARIRSGQSDIALVGGAQNSERKEMLLLYEFAQYNLTKEFQPVWARHAHPVLEHAGLRQHRPAVIKRPVFHRFPHRRDAPGCQTA